MTKKVAVQLKDWTFNSKESVSIIVFLQDFKAASTACNILKGIVMWIFKHYLSSSAESFIKARVALLKENTRAQEGCVTSYYTIVNYLLKQYATDDNIASADADNHSFTQRNLMATDYTQQIWTKRLRCGSVYPEKMVKGIFLEGLNR